MDGQNTSMAQMNCQEVPLGSLHSVITASRAGGPPRTSQMQPELSDNTSSWLFQSKFCFPPEEGQELKLYLSGPQAPCCCWRGLAYGQAGSEMLNDFAVVVWFGKALTGRRDRRKPECENQSVHICSER